jgi:hypothetical protein
MRTTDIQAQSFENHVEITYDSTESYSELFAHRRSPDGPQGSFYGGLGHLLGGCRRRIQPHALLVLLQQHFKVARVPQVLSD